MSINVNTESPGLIQHNTRLLTVAKSLEGKSLIELSKGRGQTKPIDDDRFGPTSMHAETEEEAKARKEQEKLVKMDASSIIQSCFNKKPCTDFTFVINNVTFTGDEMESVQAVVRNAVSSVKETGSFLDYDDYVNMGIAESMVRTYGKENLTEEQAEIVNKVVADYMDNLIEAQEEKLHSGGYYLDTSNSGSGGELNKYYAIRSSPITQEECQRLQDSIRKMNIPEANKSTLLANIEASTRIGGVVQAASNKELASSIRSTFASVNINNYAECQSAYQKYKNGCFLPCGLMVWGGIQRNQSRIRFNTV